MVSGSVWFNLQTTTWNESLFQLRATRGGNLVSSMGAGIIHLWRASTGKFLSQIRGNVPYLFIYFLFFLVQEILFIYNYI